MGYKKHVTKEQIERARTLDLLSYLQTYEPSELSACQAASTRCEATTASRFLTGNGCNGQRA